MKSEYMREQLRAIPFALAFIAAGVGFFLVPSVTAAIFASILFMIAAAIVVEDHLLARRGRRAQGTVVEHEEVEGCFLPVIEYIDSKGVTRRQKTKTGRGTKSPSVGSRVVIIYDESGRHWCEIDTFFRRWGVALGIAVLGSIFAIGAASAK